jgi:hypothetical protein
MAMVIRPKRKFTAGAPGTGDLVEGEIAINTADKKLYVRDNANTIIEIGGGGSGGSTTEVTQSSHGLAVKDGIRHNGTAWVKAVASGGTTLALGVVVAVANSNTFTVAQSGRFELTSHGLTVGQWYYLDATTAGALTATEPGISQPLVYVESSSHVFVYPYRPTQILTSATPLGIFVDEFTGDGSDTTFTMGGDPIAETNTQVYLNGVYQEKATYSVSGTTLTFSTAPANSTSVEVVRYAASAVTIGIPDDNTVTTAKIADGSITAAKFAAGAISNASIPDNSITTAKLVNGTIITVDLADDAVTTAKIADAQITTALIADDAVTADKLANSINSAITANTAKVTNAITTHTGDVTGGAALTIANNAVDIAKLAVTDGTAGQFLKTDGNNVLSFGTVAAPVLSYNAWVITATAVTAVNGSQIMVTGTSAVTITLPAGVAGHSVSVRNNSSATVTIARNGSDKINSTADNGEIAASAGSQLVFANSTLGWMEV